MGVAGSGKSTVARALADRLRAGFLEADLYHPPENIAAMSRGEPLDDGMRWGWLDAVGTAAAEARGTVVVACSALKRRYRDRLREKVGPMPIVHLAGDRALLARRMAERTGHFMPPSLLDSQFADLEPPGADEDAVALDVADPPRHWPRRRWPSCGRASPRRPPRRRPTIIRKPESRRSYMTMRFATALALATVLGSGAMAQDQTFRFQSSDPAGNPNFELQKTWAEDVAERTGGRVQIDLLPVESIVAHNETQDAIAAGILDGHITDTSYFAGKDPAFSLIANPVGAWSDPQEMFDFMSEGGGKELMNEL